ncbi:uncharacterized protein [Chironomus tepperi]|uniref:uncharacterized protein isoform X2 n=1 Tax=Chironomus tepperi TaxID=113505 RepID=UPI00391FB80C
MEQKNTMNVAKIIACILIVSYLTCSTVAAPLADSSQQSGSIEKKHNKKSSEEKKNIFTNKDVEMWTNPCSSESIMDSSISVSDMNANFEEIRLTASYIDVDLRDNEKINTTNYKAWDEFNARDYEFLPQKPTGNHRQWHFDLQKYVATFILLHKRQKIDDEAHNNNTMSEELGKILRDAKHLLCDIEHFINATSSQKIGQKDWIKKGEMRNLTKFRNITAMFLNRTYAKGRFQDYIQKLMNRIKQQSAKNFVEKNVTYPKLKSIKKNKQQGTKRARKGNKRNQNGRKIDQQNEVAVTKRTHIVRTSKNPAQARNNVNKNNRRRQRTRTTTSSSTVAL